MFDMGNWILGVGDFLKNRRKQLGLTQRDLADDNLSESSISNLENGKSGKKALQYYCEKLDIKYEDLARLLMEEKKKKEVDLSEIKLRLKSVENDFYCVSEIEAL